jgi:hypothetical protein
MGAGWIGDVNLLQSDPADTGRILQRPDANGSAGSGRGAAGRSRNDRQAAAPVRPDAGRAHMPAPGPHTVHRLRRPRRQVPGRRGPPAGHPAAIDAIARLALSRWRTSVIAE